MLTPFTEKNSSPVFAVSWATTEEVMAQDPFSGNGIKLNHPGGVTPEDLADLVLDVLGCPCIAAGDIAWADLSGTGMSADEARKRWDTKIRSLDPGAEHAVECGESNRLDQRQYGRFGNLCDLDGTDADRETAY
jgi:hypothetical protein